MSFRKDVIVDKFIKDEEEIIDKRKLRFIDTTASNVWHQVLTLYLKTYTRT